MNSLSDLAGLLKDSVDANADIEDDSSIVIGYSGGLDSSLLLQAAALAFPTEKLLAFHCDHGLSDNAESWSQHCREQTQLLSVPFVEKKLSLGQGVSEEVAREARYRYFSEHMEKLLNPVLLLAHHADDQLETLLFRLFRGSGLKGLSAIPESRNMEQGVLFRPFLGVSKSVLLNIAQRENISWIEDDSNQTDDYDRNFLRNKLLPLIYQRWPRAADQILHAKDIFQESESLLGEYAESLIPDLEPEQGAFGRSFCITKLQQFSEAQYRLVLRHLVFTSAGVQLTNSDLSEIESQFFYSKDGASPEFKIGSAELRRYKGRLYILNNFPKETDQTASIGWDGKQPLEIMGLGTLSLVEGGNGLFEIRFRRGSERAKPVSREHSQTLKKLMQESDIEPWLRSRVPLVFSGDELLSVGDSIRCSEHEFKWQWQS